MSDTETVELIRPIIYRTYGKGSMPKALAGHLAEKVDRGWPRRRHDETREDMIRDTCWIWFSGGDTAASVAREIENALR